MTASAISCSRASASCAWASAAFAFERERHRRKGDDERAGFARDLRDHRRGAGAGPATETRADKDHARIRQRLPDFIRRLRGRVVAELRIAAGAESTRDGSPELNFVRRHRAGERLHVGVDRDEIGLVHAIEHDAIEDIRAGAADADHFDRDDIFLFAFGQAVVATKLDHKVTPGRVLIAFREEFSERSGGSRRAGGDRSARPGRT